MLQACDVLVLVTITVPSTEKIEVVVMGRLSNEKSASNLSYVLAMYVT